MRQVMSISLPPEIVSEIKREAKREKCATLSEFIRHLMRQWRKQRLAEELKASSLEFKAGNGILLKSLKDLR